MKKTVTPLIYSLFGLTGFFLVGVVLCALTGYRLSLLSNNCLVINGSENRIE